MKLIFYLIVLNLCLHVLYRWVPQALSYAGFVGDRGSAVLSDFGKGVP